MDTRFEPQRPDSECPDLDLSNGRFYTDEIGNIHIETSGKVFIGGIDVLGELRELQALLNSTA